MTKKIKQEKKIKCINKNISEIGFGTYRLFNIDEHKAALEKALLSGVNLIDTSSNYTDGDSEKCIGEVIKDCEASKKIDRKDLCIVSKAGYIQGTLLKKVKEDNLSFESVITLEPYLMHCISPDFIEHQISQSLQRLQTDYLDVFLLHNPEYFLLWAKKESQDPTKALEQYYQQINQALDYCESEVKKGRILSYGISSNTFAATQVTAQSTSLETLLKTKENHPNFSVIQCPFNLLETEAITETPTSLFNLAKKEDLTTLINRPLNAIIDNRLIRLVELQAQDDISYIEVDDCLDAGIALEESIKNELEPHEHLAQLKEHLNFFKILKDFYTHQDNYFNFLDVISHSFVTAVDNYFALLEQIPPPELIQESFQEYFKQFNYAVKSVSTLLSYKHNDDIMSLKTALKSELNTLQTDLSMEQLTLRLYRSTNEIDCTLLGMRQTQYVNMCVNECQQSQLEIPENFWNNLAINRNAHT